MVGAGPVGLACALVLADRGIPVSVLEAADKLSTASRASTFHPATLDLLGEVGVAAPLVAAGRKVGRIQWRDLAQRVLAEIDYSLLAGRTAHPFRVHVEQAALTPLLLARLNSFPHAEVLFSAEVVGLNEGTHGARVRFRNPAGARRSLEAGYLVAADGSRSRVRTLLGLPDGAQDYPTYALRVITQASLDTIIPGLTPLAYVRDSQQSFSVLGMPDHWRLIFRISHQVPRDRVTDPDHVRDLLRRSLPAAHRRVRVTDAHTYRLASFVMPRYRVGRVLFAGDAAHISSTAGGMNMNCGLHDAFEWGRAIAAVMHGERDETALDAVADRRRSAALDAVIPRSEARTAGLGSAAALRQALDDIRRTAGDPELAADYLFKASLLDCAPAPAATSRAPDRNADGSAPRRRLQHANLVPQAHGRGAAPPS